MSTGTVNATLHTPVHLQQRDQIVRYMLLLYRHYLFVSEGTRTVQGPLPPPPSALSEELSVDCHAAARMLVEAVRNKCKYKLRLHIIAEVDV